MKIWFQSVLLLLLLLVSENSLAQVSWSSGTKAPADYTSSGAVTITGNVTLQAGTYTFTSLTVNSGVTLTLQGNTGSNTGVIINTTDLNVISTGVISANSQGLAGVTGGSGSGSGSGSYGPSGGAGAGYGGTGGKGNSFGTPTSPGVAYGASSGPTQLGSSGGANAYNQTGGAGGGAIKVVATGTVTVNGTISANGGAGTGNSGGGSGGSIWISTPTIAGSGTISTAGGSGYGGGSGGRVYVTYSSSNTFAGTWSSAGGSGTNVGGGGSLLIVNTATNDVFCPAAAGSTFLSSDLPSPLGNLTVQNGCLVTLDAGLSFASISVSGTGSGITSLGDLSTNVSGSFSISNSTITINGNLNVGGGVSMTSSSTMNITGNSTIGSGYVISSSSSVTLKGNLSIGGDLSITSSSTMSVVGNTTTGVGYTVSATNISVDATSTVSANGLGFPGAAVNSNGSGFVVNSNPTYGHYGYSDGSGAGYGGAGGTGYSSGSVAGGVTYGTATNPVSIGSSGGGSFTVAGGSGGGAIKLVASGTLAMNGTLSANGNAGTLAAGGGGSGGSLWIVAGTLSGSGVISAIGGNGYGAGGGGRIYTAYSSANNFAGTWSAAGGTGTNPGGVGSILFFNSSTNDLVCSNSTTLVLVSGDLPGFTGGLLVSGGCQMTIPGGTFTSVSVSGTGTSLTSTGDVTTNAGGDFSITSANALIKGNLNVGGNINVTSTGTLSMGGNTTTGNGYTVWANNITADSTSAISANGLGYPAPAINASGTGPGAGIMVYSYGAAASYGGVGGAGLSGGLPYYGAGVYGTVTNPINLGSSGGSSFAVAGGAGGGAIKLVVSGTLAVNGTLSANGNSGTNSAGGSGSGGSLWIVASTLSGSGAITAIGGSGYAGGGGGRIFMTYSSANTFAGSWSVAGGTGTNPGGAGSILFENIATSDVICSLPVVETLTTGDLTGISGGLTIQNGCQLTIPASMTFASLTVSGSGSSLLVPGDFSTNTSGAATISNSATATVNGNFMIGGNMNLTSTATVVIGGNTTTGYGYVVGASNLSVDSTSKISTNAQGYAGTVINSGNGPGAGGYAFNYGGGGGYGGAGGAGASTGGAGGATYGSAVSPNQLGSSGGASGTTSSIGGAGGGAIQLFVAGTATLNGTLSANGGNGLLNGGGGSGGSLWLNIGTLAGSGTISANGGNGSSANAGCGGGGRIAISATTKTYSGVTQALVGTGSGACAAGTINNATVGVATKLAFTTQPSSLARMNTNFALQPIVAAEDTNGNIVVNYSTAMTLAAYTDAACTTPAPGTLGGSATRSAYGVTWYGGVNYSTPNSTIYIKASSGSLVSACSTAVVVAGAAATKITFTTEPSTTSVAGTNFAQQPIVTAQDGSGNTDYYFTNSVTINAYSDATCSTAFGSGTLSGSSTTTSGVAPFSGVNFTKVGVIYLKATASGVTSDCSTGITITVGPMSKIGYTTQPSSSVTVGVTLPQQPYVAAQDAYGNTITTYSGTVTVGLYTSGSCGTAKTGGTFVGTAASMTSGLASFTDISYTLSGTYYLLVSSGGFTGCSQGITFVAGPAVSISFTTQPSSTATAGTNFGTSPKATAIDSYGNGASGVSPMQLDAYSDNTCTTPVSGGTLSASSNPVTVTNGLGSYSNVKYTKAPSTIYLKVTTGSLTACSNAIVVSVGAANKVIFTTQPSATGKSGVVLTQQPTVTVQDSSGNTITTYSTAVTLAAYTDSGCTTVAGGTLSGSATTTSGVAPFSGVKYSAAGTIYLRAASGALTKACSTAIVLTSSVVPMFFRGY